jgi:hypothetical protein
MSHRWVRGFTLKFLYPVLMLMGAFFKNKKEDYQKFIINLNNKLVKKERPKAQKILLLLPHCIQTTECKIRLTYNIYNCERCGKCEIRDLIQIADENHLNLSVVTGGSLARRVVNDIKPEAVVAVACENDLSSGIADTYPLPILGIPNERPFGPCINTRVEFVNVK